jgi:hypothetical protein
MYLIQQPHLMSSVYALLAYTSALKTVVLPKAKASYYSPLPSYVYYIINFKIIGHHGIYVSAHLYVKCVIGFLEVFSLSIILFSERRKSRQIVLL